MEPEGVFFMKAYFEIVDNVLVVKLGGEIDHSVVGQIREDIEKTAEEYLTRHIIMDFGKVEFMDSAGIGMVLGRYNKLKDKEQKLVVCNCNDCVKRILFMAGVFTIVQYGDNLMCALDLLSEEDEL